MSNQKLPGRQETSKALLNQSGENAGSLIGFALSNMSHGQRSNLANKASEEALRLEVKQRELHIDYLAGQQQVSTPFIQIDNGCFPGNRFSGMGNLVALELDSQKLFIQRHAPQDINRRFISV